MGVRLLCFDLDGVLFDGNILHFEALNKALKEVSGYEITLEDHHTIFNGLPTRAKLKMLVTGNRVRVEDVDKICELKQTYTWELIKERIQPDPRLKQVLIDLWLDGYKLICVSNSIRATVDLLLERLDLKDSFAVTISNEDVRNPKPHAEPYITAMVIAGTFPDETIVIEDNENGFESAEAAGCHLFKVKGPQDITYKGMKQFIYSVLKEGKK